MLKALSVPSGHFTVKVIQVSSPLSKITVVTVNSDHFSYDGLFTMFTYSIA